MQYLKLLEGDKVQVKYKKINMEISIPELLEKKVMVLDDKKSEECNIILDSLDINYKILYLGRNNSGELILTNIVRKILPMRMYLLSCMTKKNIWFYGIISDKNKKKATFDNIYFNSDKVGTVKRPFKKIGLKDIAIAKIPMTSVLDSGMFNNMVRVGNSDRIAVPLRKIKTVKKGAQYYSHKNVENKYILIRTTPNSSNIRITGVPMQPEYKKINLFKNSLARLISKVMVKKNIVLMFEKESKRAEESGYYIFEKIQDRKFKKTKTYFIIDKNAKAYKSIKEKHGKYILEKFSFRYYLYIYLSKYFVSSELSSHIVSARFYIKSLNDEINKKPLVFLQHGIMFAKPVDNPAALGFHKGRSQINIWKNVISSDLEATQFYKMGYDDNDLIKCGLTKFDTSFMNKDADKILFMQTYRYWEEAALGDEDKIKETTYYKSNMEVIKAFEKAGMLDKFRVSCHPKVAECMVKSAPEYKEILQPDLTAGLAESKVFITDYSSASYDAHYRGAYILYYWADKDYLIEQYQAIPALNETNCDGVPVYSPEELVKEVKNAIAKNYVMDKEYEDRYRKINEFHDGKNGERLIEELIKLEVLK